MSRIITSCLSIGAIAAIAASGGVVMGGFAAGLGGNLATDAYKFLNRRVAERYFDGWSGIDENHHVSRALRLAHINALRLILKRFDTAIAEAPSTYGRDEPNRFSGVVKDFLARETKNTQMLALSRSEEISAQEQALRTQVLSALPDGFDTGLAARREAKDKSALQDSLRQLRHAVETAVLEEIRVQVLNKDEEFPSLFLALFLGTGHSQGWFDLFIRDAASKVKEGGEFSQIWAAEQTAIIKAIVRSHDQTLLSINATATRIEGKIDKLPSELLELIRGGDKGADRSVYTFAAASYVDPAIEAKRRARFTRSFAEWPDCVISPTGELDLMMIIGNSEKEDEPSKKQIDDIGLGIDSENKNSRQSQRIAELLPNLVAYLVLTAQAKSSVNSTLPYDIIEKFSCHVDWHAIKHHKDLLSKRNIISFGGGDTNLISQGILNYYHKDLPARFERATSSHSIFCEASGPLEQRRFQSIEKNDERNTAILLIAPNPLNPRKIAIVLAGLTALGTQAAMLALCDPKAFSINPSIYEGNYIRVIRAIEQNSRAVRWELLR